LHERGTSGAGRWRHGFYTLREIPSVDEAVRRFIPFWVMLYACITEIDKKTEEQEAAFRSKPTTKTP
jgi:hypothetical protein